MIKKIALATAVSLATYGQSVNASEGGQGPVSMGLQLAPLTYGLSLRYATSDQWRWQAVISPSPYSDINYTLRALHTTRRSDYWNSYLFAGVANGLDFSEPATVLSGGLGVEWSWGTRNNKRPPLQSSLEFGLGYKNSREEDFSSASIEPVYTDVQGIILVLGFGLHYQF